jgi:hypothetical protein
MKHRVVRRSTCQLDRRELVTCSINSRQDWGGIRDAVMVQGRVTPLGERHGAANDSDKKASG